ncbi:SAM-dependent methyltransferase [Micromonospora sp. RL09-050-HVF-A]|uniref:SAM-dependent methyltransferase n=1 Tax=unclassified Micromonospora TaxID=2617518 RepID=UPI001C5D57B5|nr:SAM-dependent methyltransferase [Micromonospora sp. RL09-050-HVF-A]MBW4703614.1 SAM-dependent methyltransferase [Micromonospora sp. RL09-050-HVF-A]
MNAIRWRYAMDAALYGPRGFFVSGSGPADHFRTSVHASPAFTAAVFRLVSRLDAALGFPTPFDVVDVGAGRGELLRALAALAHGSATPGAAATPLAHRLRLTAVEPAPRPADLPPDIAWTTEPPAGITGLLTATEWLDNVPLDVAVPTGTGWRYHLVDPSTGEETPGPPLTPEDLTWLTTWHPTPIPTPTPAAPPTTAPVIKRFASTEGPEPDANLLITGRGERGGRVEVGRSRDEAWGRAVGRLRQGVALAVDYGHLRERRPVDGTLTGYRNGRQVPPVPDGSCDITAHVAMDSVAAAGAQVAGCAYTLVSQREALLALGADSGRPALSLAGSDPAGYVRALAAASAVAELTDPAGLGGHHWLLQPVGVAVDALMAR